jgi:hypothetical protein
MRSNYEVLTRVGQVRVRSGVVHAVELVSVTVLVPVAVEGLGRVVVLMHDYLTFKLLIKQTKLYNKLGLNRTSH